MVVDSSNHWPLEYVNMCGGDGDMQSYENGIVLRVNNNLQCHIPQGSIIVHPKQLNLLCQYNFADIIKNTHDDMLILLFCLRANNFNSPGGRESECVSVCMRERKWEHGEMMGECKRHSSDEGAPGEK